MAAGSWSPGEAWGFGWNVVTKRFSTVALPLGLGAILAAIPVYAIMFGAMFSLQILGEQGALDRDQLEIVQVPVLSFSYLIALVVQTFMYGGYMNLALKAARGQPTAFGDVFSGGRTLVKYFIFLLVAAILVDIGLFLCVVPGVIVALGLSLGYPLMTDQGLSAIDAMKRSWEMTKGHKLNIFLFALIGILVFIGGAFACGLGILFVSAPMAWVGLAYIYLRIKGENPPVPT
jgi:uncharacterized membrane protein